MRMILGRKVRWKLLLVLHYDDACDWLQRVSISGVSCAVEVKALFCAGVSNGSMMTVGWLHGRVGEGRPTAHGARLSSERLTRSEYWPHLHVYSMHTQTHAFVHILSLNLRPQRCQTEVSFTRVLSTYVLYLYTNTHSLPASTAQIHHRVRYHPGDNHCRDRPIADNAEEGGRQGRGLDDSETAGKKKTSPSKHTH